MLVLDIVKYETGDLMFLRRAAINHPTTGFFFASLAASVALLGTGSVIFVRTHGWMATPLVVMTLSIAYIGLVLLKSRLPSHQYAHMVLTRAASAMSPTRIIFAEDRLIVEGLRGHSAYRYNAIEQWDVTPVVCCARIAGEVIAVVPQRYLTPESAVAIMTFLKARGVPAKRMPKYRLQFDGYPPASVAFHAITRRSPTARSGGRLPARRGCPRR